MPIQSGAEGVDLGPGILLSCVVHGVLPPMTRRQRQRVCAPVRVRVRVRVWSTTPNSIFSPGGSSRLLGSILDPRRYPWSC